MEIPEYDLRKIQTDKVSEVHNWANILRSQEKDKRIKLSIVVANNH